MSCTCKYVCPPRVFLVRVAKKTKRMRARGRQYGPPHALPFLCPLSHVQAFVCTYTQIYIDTHTFTRDGRKVSPPRTEGMLFFARLNSKYGKISRRDTSPRVFQTEPPQFRFNNVVSFDTNICKGTNVRWEDIRRAFVLFWLCFSFFLFYFLLFLDITNSILEE